MPLSSNSIIHFSNDKAKLLGILTDNFHIHYCTEEYELDSMSVWVKVPMVSFCDIPLSQIKEHIGKYGSYGIGLTKEWATRTKLNPVLYLEPHSNLSANLETAFHKFLSIRPNKKVTPSQASLADVLRYVKNYQGTLVRKDGTITHNYRFSDEREWRYVPPLDPSHKMFLSQDEYEADPATYDSSISGLRLDFEPNDIKYIIINDDSEIREFVSHLQNVKGHKYSYQDVERLTTRLFTSEQILSDI